MNSEIIKILNDKKINPTPMRMLVLEQMIISKQNLSLSEIENLLYPSDRITIYRTLQTFVKKGILHCIESGKNGFIYALCTENCNEDIHFDNHPHFYCELCKRFFCTSDFSYIIEKKSNAKKYIVNSIEVKISGLCPECSKL
jgi:Fur family ferric uptake transcriptional regulator